MSFLRRGVFRHAGFRRLWAATAISELGSNIGRMAFILLIHELAREEGREPEGDVALVVFLETLPMLLLGPVAGALVDRVDRRRLLVGGDVLSFLLMMTIPWLATLDVRWPLYAVAMAFSTLGTIFHPARQSAIPDLVPREELAKANGISTTTSSVNLIVGMGFAGVLIELLGKTGAFLADGLTFAVSAVLMLGLALPRRGGEAARSAAELLRETWRGLRFVGSRPMLVFLTLAYFLTYGFVGAWIPLLPSFCEEFLHLDPDRGAPLLLSTFGVGGILGGLLGPAVGRRLGRGRVAVASLLLVAVGMVVYATTPWLAASLALLLCGGALIFCLMVQDATIVQEDVPGELLGRVFGARHPMQALGYLVATSAILLLAGAFEPQRLMLGAALSYGALVVAAIAFLPGARQLLRRPDAG